MTPAPFVYLRAQSIAHALEALNEHGDEAAILAGGQSLVPMLVMRLARPTVVVDISGLSELEFSLTEGATVRVGALVRHSRIERDAACARDLPLLATAARWVATPAIRNAGTFGGALALGDPAAEYPAVAMALDARLRLVSVKGERLVAASDFFRGAMETALQPGELLAGVDMRTAKPGDGYGFFEIAERRGDYALAGAALARRADGVARVAVFGVGDATVLCKEASAILTQTPPSDWGAALLDDVRASVSHEIADIATDPARARLGAVAVVRAVNDLLSRDPSKREAA